MIVSAPPTVRARGTGSGAGSGGSKWSSYSKTPLSVLRAGSLRA
jgi:hypothetical protein